MTEPERFQYAVDFVLSHEGRFSNNPHDPGGPTNYGISLRFLEGAGMDIDGDGDIDIQDIIAIDRTKASEIYRKNWWNKYKYNIINDIDVAKKIFDLSVNMGPKRAHKIAQISINRLQEKPITVDGILGQKTFHAINELNMLGKSNALYKELQENAKHFYLNLIADKPDFSVFKKGWLARAAT